MFCQTFSDCKVDEECFQVSVIDTDQFGSDGQRPGQFGFVMGSCGLVVVRTHQASSVHKGRGARRIQSDISFHALRHTATSLLKNAGVSDVVARDIIGHESEAVSRNYTHIEMDTKRQAMNKMPDITLTKQDGTIESSKS